MSHSLWNTRVEEGLCGRCGKVPPEIGRKCQECFRRDKKNIKRHYRTRTKLRLCRGCGKKLSDKFLWCAICLKKRSESLVSWRAKIKLEAFEAYGGARCACKKCPESKTPHIDFLTINHLAGGGTQHRITMGGHRLPGGGVSMAGYSTYAWLKRNKYPTGYNVLCWNCQWGVHINNGICPHEEK